MAHQTQKRRKVKSNRGRHAGGRHAGQGRLGRLRGVAADTAGGGGTTGGRAWGTGALSPGLMAGLFIETRMSGVEVRADVNASDPDFRL